MTSLALSLPAGNDQVLSVPAANEPAPQARSEGVPACSMPAANEPLDASVRGRTVLEIHIVGGLAAPGALVPVFWCLVGDLVAEVLLDNVDGSWGATPPPEDETLAL